MVKTTRFFWKQLRFYILWMVVLTLSIATFTQYLYIRMEEEILNNGRMNLAHSVDLSDAALREIETFAYNISTDNHVLELFNIERNEDQVTYNDIYYAYYNVRNYAFLYDLVDQYFLYMVKSRKVLSDLTASNRIEIYYDNNIAYEDMSYDQWHQSIVDSMGNQYITRQKINEEGEAFPAVDFQMALPVGLKATAKGCLVVSLDTEVLMSILTTGQNPDAAFAVIDQGRMIMSDNMDLYPAESFEFTETGVHKIGKLYQIVEQSPHTGWYYITVLPRTAVIQSAITIRNVGLILLTGLLILGVLIIVLSVSNTSQELTRIYQLMPSYDANSSDIIQDIQQSVKNIIRNNEQLLQQTEDQKQLAKGAFLSRLYTHFFSNMDELNAYIEYTGIPPFKGPYILLIVRIDLPISVDDDDYYAKYDQAKLLVVNLMNQHFGERTIIRSQAMNKVSILITDNAYSTQDISDQLRPYIIDINKSMGMHIGVVMSQEFDHVLHYPIVYNRTERIFNNKFIRGKEVMVESTDMISKHAANYIIEDEIRLIATIKSGNYTIAHDYMEKMLSEVNQNDEAALTASLDALRNTLQKVIYSELEESDRTKYIQRIHELQSAYYAQEYRQSLFAICEGICQLLSPENSKYHLTDNIKSFIRSNYNRSELSLGMIADNFNMSEKYISRFFKNATQMNISNYIEKTRMEQAVQLICNGSTNYNEIASQVGYYNYNTFYKAFYRYHGVSPKSYGK